MSRILVAMGNGLVRVGVHVQPRASKTGLAGVYGTALKVRLSEPPVDGAANQALVAFLAKALQIPERSIRIVAGHASRSKTVEIEGVSAAGIHALGEGAGN